MAFIAAGQIQKARRLFTEALVPGVQNCKFVDGFQPLPLLASIKWSRIPVHAAPKGYAKDLQQKPCKMYQPLHRCID